MSKITDNFTIETIKEWKTDSVTVGSLKELFNEMPDDAEIRVESACGGDEPLEIIQLCRAGEQIPAATDYIFLSLLSKDYENNQEINSDTWQTLEKVFKAYRQFEIALESRENGNDAANHLANAIEDICLNSGFYEGFLESEKEAAK